MNSKQNSSISVFTLAMLNVAAVMSLRGLPMMAETGLHMVFYLLFSTFLFLIPCSLVCAELATGWPEEGGVYRWVSAAFGSRWGFLAVWMQWVQNIFWYPVILGFAASVFAYFLNSPDLANSHWYSAGFIIVVYWFATLVTFSGLTMAARMTTFAVIFGSIIPVTLMIVLSALWWYSGNAISFAEGNQHWIPNLSDFNNIAFLAGIILLFAGMEVGAVHVKDLENPRRNYPKAILLSTLTVIPVFGLGAVAIALVLPDNAISLTAGIMQTFSKVLALYKMQWLVPVLGLLVALGALGGVMAWVSGPSKALLATAKHGDIPPWLARTNRKGIQTRILLVQGISVTLVSSSYLFMDNVSAAFFLLTDMTITVYLVVYFLLFISALRLRYSKPEVVRSYTIPGGKLGIWLVCGLGLTAVSFAFSVGFFPPSQLQIASPRTYVMIVAGGLLFFLAAGLLIFSLKRPEWQAETTSY